jgi:hypothetical protein
MALSIEPSDFVLNFGRCHTSQTAWHVYCSINNSIWQLMSIVVMPEVKGVTDMKAFRLTRSIALILAIFLFPPCINSTTTSAAQENHCFTCHTSARRLIKITREIAWINKDQPGASTETSGEG